MKKISFLTLVSILVSTLWGTIPVQAAAVAESENDTCAVTVATSTSVLSSSPENNINGTQDREPAASPSSSISPENNDNEAPNNVLTDVTDHVTTSSTTTAAAAPGTTTTTTPIRQVRYRVIRQYRCRICGRNCPNGTSLRRHQRGHRDREIDRNFFCVICGQAFFYISQLRSHQRTHMRIRPYECPFCHKRYSRQQSVRRHMVSMHNA